MAVATELAVSCQPLQKSNVSATNMMAQKKSGISFIGACIVFLRFSSGTAVKDQISCT
jgi:hypothetical protein